MYAQPALRTLDKKDQNEITENMVQQIAQQCTPRGFSSLIILVDRAESYLLYEAPLRRRGSLSVTASELDELYRVSNLRLSLFSRIETYLLQINNEKLQTDDTN